MNLPVVNTPAKKRRFAVSLALLAPLVLGGCGVLPGGDDTRTVTVWLMKGSATQAFVDRFVEDFEQRHSGTSLDVKFQDWSGIGAKVTRALESDEPSAPDVVEVGNTQVAQYVDHGGLLDLTLESMREWGMQDWLPGLAEPGTHAGAQYGIPWYAANRVVIYNKDLFDAADIKEPPADRKAWLALTERLDTGGNQGIYLAGQDWYTLAGFVWDEGGDLAEEREARWKGTLHSAAALRGMDFYQQLQALGSGPKDADEENPPQAEVFAAGDVAQIIAVPGTTKAIEEANPELRGRIGYFPVPGRKAGEPGAVFTGGSDLIVPERTDQRDAAVQVVAALAGKKWQTDLARTMNYVPNKTTLANVVDAEEGVAAMAAGAAEGRATPNSPRWAAVESDNPIKRYMTAVLTGADPAREARRASARITAELDHTRG